MTEPRDKLLSVVILTRNEERNLPFALRSLSSLPVEVFVVDSGSTDATAQIAADAGVRVIAHPWQTYAKQLNWAIETLPITTPWTMRLDADERLTPELVEEIGAALENAPKNVAAFEMRRRVYFWGRWIRHGGYYPIWLVRVWRTGKGHCEDLWMDEHMLVTGGETRQLRGDIIDENHKGLGFWIAKHNDYADREVKDILEKRSAAPNLRGQAGRKRKLKIWIYGNSPVFLRAFLYWAYRYFVRLGILDGLAGLVFHFLQGFWYRLLIDAKLHEAEIAQGHSASPSIR